MGMAVLFPTNEAADKSQNKKGVNNKMGDCIILLKVIGVTTYNGTSRSGRPYTLTTLELDFNDEKVRLKTFESDVKIGDYVQLSIGVRKSVYGKELAVVLDKVVPAQEIESNWK